MSSSLPVNIPYVLDLISKNIYSRVNPVEINLFDNLKGKPRFLPEFRILDIGVGFGKWGFLIRDTFEVMIAQNFDRKDWKIYLTGIEPFKKCITSIQKEVYNEIIQKDVFDAMAQLGDYDLIIMGDVIEHIEKERAHHLLEKLLEHSNNIIISTPLGFLSQGAWAGNEKEVHKSGWELDDFKNYRVVEYKILKDTLFVDLIKMKGLNVPKSRVSGIELLVLWLKKE